MAVEEFFVIRTHTATTSGIDVLAPVDCNVVSIMNVGSAAIELRSDPANANSAITIDPGLQYEISGSPPHGRRAVRFKAGDFVCNLRVAAGTQDAKGEYVL